MCFRDRRGDGGIMKRRDKKSGFTLLEMLISVAIIAALASIVITALASIDNTAKVQNCKAMLETINVALRQYRDYGYPCRIDSTEPATKITFFQAMKFPPDCNEFSIIEMNYIQNPLIWAKTKTSTTDLRQLVKTYLDYENEQLATVYMNEAKIDALIFEVYDLTDEDRQMVLDKEGVPIGDYAPFDSAQGANVVGKEITDLYEQNKSLEEICEKVKINPMAVVEVLKNSQVLPPKRMNEIAQEFLFDAVREVLEADDDGIIPLVKSAGETPLQSRLFDWLITQKGLSNAQVGNYREILGKEINDYLLKNFFTDLCNRLNLFMYLPKTPFIWHLSAGSKGSFEAYISIYKWNRDKLYRLRSVYVSKRESSLRNRLIDLQKDATIQGQAEREKITDQLEEIDEFKQKIDAILQSGYEPKLDDGVGKNIAPLQEKGMLKSEVLKKNQLKKYLEADW